jgi:CubicO group peptidase (beta-lactamase class C family)
MTSWTRRGIMFWVLFSACATVPDTAPPPRRLEAPHEVDRIVDEYRQRRAFPGAVVAFGDRHGLLHLRAFGNLTYDEAAPAVAVDTIYDLASLTKVVASTTMAMMLYDEGKLELDCPLREFLPAFRGPTKDRITVRDLLTHSSGIAVGGPLFREIQGPQAYLERIQQMDLVYEPGSESRYSDFGMILLGAVLERAAGQSYEQFVRSRILLPLGMRETGFLPAADLLSRIAPTEQDPWRGRLVRGEVHDENAHAMGGIAPHAGLFGTAADLARFAQMLLNGGTIAQRQLVAPATVALFTRNAGIPHSSRALGWDNQGAENSSAGNLFSARSYGHTGFTGTSLWLDPERGVFLILLTNRVHPTRENNLIREARRAVADALIRSLEASPRP